MFSVQEDLLKYNVLFISSVISHVVKLLILSSIYFIRHFLQYPSYNILSISYNERNVRKNTCQFHIELVYLWKD